MKTLKYLMVALVAISLTACHSMSNQGRPGDGSGASPDGARNTPVQQDPSLNLRDGFNH
jgi:hypothetical protein